MKIFLDTADRNEIAKWVDTGLIDGVTTNPSLLAKQGSKPKEVLLEICKLVSGDVSIEVVEKDPDAVFKQALEISKLASNVVVKIPFAQQYLPVIAKLVKEGINLNITLVFSMLQMLMVAKLGVKYISPFIGRWDDIDIDGMNVVSEMVELNHNYDFSSQILAASIRTPMHWHYAALHGADVATLPPALLEKVMFHPLTERGIEKFDADWKKSGVSNLLG